jgi:hypothetical protein
MAGYVVTAGAVSAWRYFVLTNIVADALAAELPTALERNVPGVARTADPAERMARIRHMVLQGASAADVPLIPDDVTVSADGNVVTVLVRHVYPVFEYQARRITIPITVERSQVFP